MDEEKTVESKPEKEEKVVEKKPAIEKKEELPSADEEKTVESKPEKEEKVVEEKPAVEKKEEQAPTKKKKIRKMCLEEVEERLKSVESTMGGFHSKFAQHLLKRKEELTKR